MEKLFRLLPGPQPILVRYGFTVLFVLVGYGIRIALGNFTGAYGFLFFILPIVASALLFDRGTGFFAVALSTVLVGSLLEWGERTGPHIVALSSSFWWSRSLSWSPRVSTARSKKRTTPIGQPSCCSTK